MRCVSGLRCALAVAALAALVAATPIAARAEGRIALVIGNDRYPDLPADRQLTKAVNDANTIGDALEKIGFTVIRGANLDRQGMVDRIFEFTQKIKPGDSAMMFYAGHGVAISSGNYLLPTDVRIAGIGEETRVRNMTIGEADMIADIQERKPRVAVLVLDACRDNPFRQPGLTRSVGADQGLIRAQEAEGVFAIYSAGFGQSALDNLGPEDKSPNSVFTRVLAPALSRTDAHLADIVIDVREEVARLAATINHPQYPAYYDQTRGGRLYLVPRSITISPTIEPPSKNTDRLPAEPGAADNSAIAALPPAKEPDASVATTSRSIFYEEDPANPYGKRFDGSAKWRSELDNKAGQPSGIAVTADIVVPDLGMTISLSFQRNTDKSLPAAYLVEIKFVLPAGFDLGEVGTVPGIVMKAAEDRRGIPLTGEAAKVTNGIFLIGLSAAETERNEKLLKENPWFDIPMIFANGHRAILALEKGAAGETAFNTAFAAWLSPRDR